MSTHPITIGIDVGGTFTDAIAVNTKGEILCAFKLPSTPSDPASAVITALERIAQTHDIRNAIVCHGTTVGTNTLIERKGAKVVLLATEGFTDVIELRRQDRPALYDLTVRVSEPLVPQTGRVGVAERLNAAGEVIKPLEQLARVVDDVIAIGPFSIAISLLHSYANGEHEIALRAALQQALPGAFITVSHDVCPEFREFERTSTTVVNAYIGPAVSQYIRRVATQAEELGVGALMIVKSNGGLTSPVNAQMYPVHLIESGPAAGMIATAAYAKISGRPNVIAFDMGGTTAKAGVIQGFKPKITDQFNADHLVNGKHVGGYPVRSAVLDIIEVGAGGGSIAWIDAGGVPKVGPESAGADPGPACYSRGGTRPTVTDAHAVIGTLGVQTFVGTGVTFSREHAVMAIEKHIAIPMGWTLSRAAHAIIELAVANMTEMVRLATVRRGLDPRDFSIIASGGAGPLHVAAIGREVGVKDVVVPPYPGIFSALGAMLGSIRHDLSRTLLRHVEALELREVGACFEELAAKASALMSTENESASEVSMKRFADLRYVGQLSELRVGLGEWDAAIPSAPAIERAFRDTYQAEFGFDLADASVELVTLHLIAESAVGNAAQAVLAQEHAYTEFPDPIEHRRVLEADGSAALVPVYRSVECGGATLKGPLILDHGGSTIWVPPGSMAEIGRDGAITFRFDGANS